VEVVDGHYGEPLLLEAVLVRCLLLACYRHVRKLPSEAVRRMKEVAGPYRRGTQRRRGSERSCGGQRPFPLAVVLVVAAVSMAACGGSPSKGLAGHGSSTITSPSSAPQAPLANALRFANCMRSNGVPDYPDPTSNGRPQPTHRTNPGSTTFLTAFNACRKDAPAGVGGGPPPPTASQLRFALAFAQCIREHGFAQFPDPLATAPDPDQTEFTLGQGMYFLINGTYQVQSPTFRRAAKTCGVRL
jgi:hypothetical protein